MVILLVFQRKMTNKGLIACVGSISERERPTNSGLESMHSVRGKAFTVVSFAYTLYTIEIYLRFEVNIL